MKGINPARIPFRKGKFFITIQSLFFLLNTFSLPYYFTTVSIELPFSIKLLYVVTCLVLGASIYIYPKYGHRIALVNLHSLLVTSVSMYSTFHFSGGIYSPDLTFSPAITIYTFLLLTVFPELFGPQLERLKSAIFIRQP